MQHQIDALQSQVHRLKLVTVGAVMTAGIALMLAIGSRESVAIDHDSPIDFDVITTRKLIIESHDGAPWLVAQEHLHEPSAPAMGGNQMITIGSNASRFNCWLDGRGGIQMWMSDGHDRERISLDVRGGPNDLATITLRHPESNTEPAFVALSCNASCRDELAKGQTVTD